MSLRVAAAVAAAILAPFAHAQAPKGDPAKAQTIVTQVCAACHGADGNSPTPANPNLAGQHPEYVLKQLMNFKQQGSSPPQRSNPVMTGMVANLSPQDMSNLAAYFSGQKPKPGVAHDAQLVELGQSVYRGGIIARGVAACAGCHSPDGAGVPTEFPRLAGQHADYVVSQLKAFRSGERANDPNRMMRMTASKLSDEEIKAVAEYISGLR